MIKYIILIYYSYNFFNFSNFESSFGNSESSLEPRDLLNIYIYII